MPCWVMSAGREGALQGGERFGKQSRQGRDGVTGGLGLASITLLSPHDNPLSYTEFSALYRCGNRGSEMSSHLLKVTWQVSKSMRSDLKAQGPCMAQFQGTWVVGKTPALRCLQHLQGDGEGE